MNTTYLPPENIPLAHILPSEPLLLMGAGPVPIPHAVAQANSVVINHLGETMGRVIDRVKKMAKYAFQTESDKIMGVAGPSSAAMEMGITNLLWPGRKALGLQNGTFSERLGIDSNRIRTRMAERFNVEISGAFGLNIVRIGQMGEQCRSHNLFKTLYAMGICFQEEGCRLNISEGMAAMQKSLAEDPHRYVT